MKSTNTVEAKQTPMNLRAIKKSLQYLKAINHPLRQRILALIEEREMINVTKLYVELRIEQSVASQHLSVLRNLKIIKATRSGKYTYYSINQKNLQKINQMIDAINNKNG